MLISIITPVYNSQGYLEECIKSVLNQTSDDWELILVDDGSTDSSPAICDRYAKNDNRIKIIHKKNTGQFDSRLHGIMQASGEYCTFLDSDDYLEPNCIDVIRDQIYDGNYDIIAWNLRVIQENKEITRASMERYGEYTGDDFLEYVIKSTNHSLCNKLIRTSAFKNAYYGEASNDIRYSEDYIMLCPAICTANRVLAIDSVLYNYRQIEESVTHNYSTKRIIDYLDASKSIRYIFEHYGKSLPRFVDAENGSLVSSIGYCLKQAYKNNRITQSDITKIRQNSIYKQLQGYENTLYITTDLVFLMKLFRYHLDFVIRQLYR